MLWVLSKSDGRMDFNFPRDVEINRNREEVAKGMQVMTLWTGTKKIFTGKARVALQGYSLAGF